MFSYGSQTADVVRGKRTKRGSQINVQPTALGRRKFRERGKGPSSKGRRLREVEEHARMQIVVNDDSDDEGTYYFSLPNKKQKTSSQKHSLKLATEKNISAARKH